MKLDEWKWYTMVYHTDSKHYSYGSHHWIIPDWLPGMYRLVTAYVFKVAIPSLLVYPPTMNHPGGVAEITMITTTTTVISPECPYHKKTNIMW